MASNKDNSRRKFIQHAGIAGAGLVLAGPLQIFAQTNTKTTMSNNIKTRGYAGKDIAGKMVPWNFERRPVGDNDILIEIKYSGICHSDIHTIKGHWGPQKYPQVPGHEIAGIVTAVGKNVTKFKVGDQAGVGCMVNSCMQCDSCKSGEEQIEGKPIEIIKKGSVVKCPPNVRHWHGASADVGLQQLYIVPNTEKGIVNWDEAVTDEAYKSAR
jgi:alcohol dehydrogenase (NADP+)